MLSSELTSDSAATSIISDKNYENNMTIHDNVMVLFDSPICDIGEGFASRVFCFKV
jgi:hypothetical protein